MKTSVGIVIIVATVLWPLAASAQQAIARVGSLSPQRAFAESAEGKAGIARLQVLEEKQSREIETSFLTKLRPAVEQVAKTKQLQLVVNLDTDSVMWADTAIDITDVVKQLSVAEQPLK